MSFEIQVLEEAVEVGTQRGCYPTKQVVAIVQSIGVIKQQLKERGELMEEVKELRLQLTTKNPPLKEEAEMKPIKHKGN